MWVSSGDAAFTVVPPSRLVLSLLALIDRLTLVIHVSGSFGSGEAGESTQLAAVPIPY